VAWVLFILQYFRAWIWRGDDPWFQGVLSFLLIALMSGHVLGSSIGCRLVESPCPQPEEDGPGSYLNRETNQCTGCPLNSSPNSDYDGCECDDGYTPSGRGCEECPGGTTSDGGGDALSKHAVECEEQSDDRLLVVLLVVGFTLFFWLVLPKSSPLNYRLWWRKLRGKNED